MKRSILRLVIALFALTVTYGIAAEAPVKQDKKPTAKQVNKQPAKAKPGSTSSQPVKTKNTKKVTAAKPNTNTKPDPKTKPNTDIKVVKTAAKTNTKTLPRLLDIGSTTCIPCKMMMPILDDLSKRYKGKLKVEFIDIKKDKNAVDKYKIKSIPTQIFYDTNGKEVYRHQGFYPKEDILKKFKELGIKL